jgi:hypothetical protein
MEEQLSARELLKFLKEAGKSNECIIELLVSMIQTKMLMGGDIADSINYEVEKIKKELYK